jgi:ribosomal protein L7/L12
VQQHTERTGDSTLTDTYSILQGRLDHIEEQLGKRVPDYVSYSAAAGQGLPPEIGELARAGKKIAAIKAYRRHTGVGLAEAKAFIDRL